MPNTEKTVRHQRDAEGRVKHQSRIRGSRRSRRKYFRDDDPLTCAVPGSVEAASTAYRQARFEPECGEHREADCAVHRAVSRRYRHEAYGEERKPTDADDSKGHRRSDEVDDRFEGSG